MKKAIFIAAITALVWTSPALANDEHHPEQQKKASTPSASADAKTPQKKANVKPESPDTTQAGMPMGMMENMEKMQRQMEKIQATTDPKERQKLMQEHMEAMQKNMKAMRGMGGSMMMGDHKEMAGGDMMKHHDMMEKRMEMMQMMMEQMMQHQNAQESAPASK